MEFDDTNSNYCPLCGTSYHDAVNLTTHMWENHADLMGPKKRGRPKKILTTVSLWSFMFRYKSKKNTISHYHFINRGRCGLLASLSYLVPATFSANRLRK